MSITKPSFQLPITSSLHHHSGILGELSAIVQASPTVRDHLGPALLHTYAEVNVVEGLDVDKEDFDKFATRSANGFSNYTIMHLHAIQCMSTGLCDLNCMQELFLGKDEISLPEGCPHLRGVHREVFHC